MTARATYLVILALGGAPVVALAQVDYRNLDDGRPVRTEDAFVVDHHAFEALAPFGYDADVSGARRYLFQPELEWGALPNTQVSLKLPLGVVDSGGRAPFGLGGVTVTGIYNLNEEGPTLPAFAVRSDVLLPAGSLAGDRVLWTIKGVASRTFGLVRTHLNAAWTVGTSLVDGPRLEAPPRWFIGGAVDYTFFRPSLLVVGELTALQDYDGAPTELSLGGGIRWQWTPTLVLDAGAERRLTGNAGPDIELTLGLTHTFGVRRLMPRPVAPASEGTPGRSRARSEEFYYPGGFNWKFLANYPEAARLFNAFDYGHATLYEHLLVTPSAELDVALDREYAYLTNDLLRAPPRFGVAEVAIEPAYARIAWRAKLMFDWAHVLHRQIYDVYADPSLTPMRRDTVIEQLTDYYLRRGDRAFSVVPKSMALMDDQWFSQAFRRREPRFNGLIWAYHWLQVGLYEPFIEGAGAAGVAGTVAHFWAMVDGGETTMPRVMPMTSAVAPQFAAQHPRAAVIFDNLHMMHDIISDILVNDSLSRAEKSRLIDAQLDEFRDPAHHVISMEEWRAMADHMGGVEAMGGRAGRAAPAAPAPAAEHHQH